MEEKRANLQEMLSAAADPVISDWLASQGMVRGQFQPTRSIVDTMDMATRQRQLTEAMGTAAQGDRGSHERLLRGFASLTGQEWTPELQSHAETVSGGLAAISPHMMRWAPETWDTLHGSTGSAASLTKAIADANQHTGMTPEEAMQQARGVQQALYGDNDPMAHRGFSSHEMGQIYTAAHARGLITAGGNPQQTAAALKSTAGPISAIRDALGARGQTQEISELFAVYDAMPTDLGPNDMETRIRTGDELGRQGGAWAAANRNYPTQPPAPGRASLADASAQDSQLRHQAGASAAGNLATVTMRLHQFRGFDPDSPAGQLVSQISHGNMPKITAPQWMDIMEKSGVPRASSMPLLSQTATNAQFMTPEIANSVRQSQYKTDIQPVMNQATQSAGGNQMVAKGARNEAAVGLGYNSTAHMQQLHGQGASGVHGAMAQAKATGAKAKSVSGIGRGTFGSRLVSAVQDATGPQDIGNVVARSMGGVPQASLPSQIKSASVYDFQGDVQGMGLRKTLHAGLDEAGLKGMAVNNARTGSVSAYLPGDAEKIKAVLAKLDAHIRQKGGSMSYTQREGKEDLVPVNMTPQQSVDVFRRQGFKTKQRHTAAGEPLGNPEEWIPEWLMQRYRLQRDGKNITGSVPQLAYQQIQGEEPIYAKQLIAGVDHYQDDRWAKSAADLAEIAADVIAKAVGVETPTSLKEREKERKRIEAQAKRSLNERRGRRLAKVRAQGLPDALAEKVTS